MSESPSESRTAARRELMIVAALTVIGGLLRAWALGRIGLVHFDEGIYAMAGTWALSPHGIAAFDASVIPYAPPGFPFLVGVMYSLLGAGDTSAILVSIVAGTLTIPVVGWLGRRTFGIGAGAAASAFAALSGPHLAFSRMALTDVSFLLVWLIAIGLGQRFFEKPNPWRALAFGASVGAAQLFKYNGWLAGAIVVVAAVVWTLARPEGRRLKGAAALWGSGLAAAFVAAVVYWPWFRFVESHGGYAALLAHQRSYLSGFDAWPAHTAAQLHQERAMSGGFGWMLITGLAGAVALLVATGDLLHGRRLSAVAVLTALSLPALCGFMAPFLVFGLIGSAAVFWRIRAVTPGMLVLATGWILLAILTPFYHPYARLLLPLQAVCWLMMAEVFRNGRALFAATEAMDRRTILGVPRSLVFMTCLVWAGAIPMRTTYWALSRPIGDILGPGDSLRIACREIAGALPPGLESLRAFARPPITFYLAGVVRLAPQASADAVFQTRAPSAWVLIDSAMVRQGGGMRGLARAAGDRWELVREFPTTMNLPTWFDVDPSAATGGASERGAPLLLFRPKPSEGDR